jgi:hypothetical protein
MPAARSLRTEPETQMTRARVSATASHIEESIVSIRGQRVMLDEDLAALYGVSTKRLNEQVKRNRARFPVDFMFQLGAAEVIRLRSQSATSNGRGGRRTAPHVFTEQGVAMLSSVLHSPRAIQVNIEIMRAFVRLRHVLAGHKELAGKLAELEKRYDGHFRIVFEAIEQLMAEEAKPKRRIGFGG